MAWGYSGLASQALDFIGLAADTSSALPLEAVPV